MPIQDAMSLVEFESSRRSLEMIPPDQSNSYYQVGSGTIDLFTFRADVNNPRFDLTIKSGEVNTGEGLFFISGDIDDPDYPYRDMYVNEDTSLYVEESLTISRGTLDVTGSIEILPDAQFIVRDNATVILQPESEFTITGNSKMFIEHDVSFRIYGKINITMSQVDNVLNNSNIFIDNTAILNVIDIDMDNRVYSISDYKSDIADLSINLYTQGEYSYPEGRVGYTWMNGSPNTNSYVIELSVQYGEAILGDFRVSMLGNPMTVTNNLKIAGDMKVSKYSSLYITEQFHGHTYISPELYIGVIIDNTDIPAQFNIYGDVYVDGKSCSILLDRGGTMIIHESGNVYLQNEGSIINSNNDTTVSLIINGTLTIDSISQIDTIERCNIELGDDAKVIILNPDTGTPSTLFSIPHDIQSSDLYRIFDGDIDKIELHIGPNIGIGIDQNYDYFARDLVDWIGGIRIEKAIYEKLIVWNSGGFIELDQEHLPWISEKTSLLEVSQLFKAYGGDMYERLQDLVNKLIYAGSGNIIFKCIYPEGSHELILNLDGLQMLNILNNPNIGKYTLTNTSNGMLFLKNNITGNNVSDVINSESIQLDIDDTGIINFIL